MNPNYKKHTETHSAKTAKQTVKQTVKLLLFNKCLIINVNISTLVTNL